MAVQINTLKIDFPISILCAVLLLILGAAGMSLGHIDGVVFIILFLAFILYMIRSAQTSREKNVEPGWKRKSIFRDGGDSGNVYGKECDLHYSRRSSDCDRK